MRRPVKLVGAVPPQAPLIIGSFESLSLDETSYVPSFLRPLPDALLCGVLAGASLLFTLAAWSAYRKFRESGGGGAADGGHPRDRVRRSVSRPERGLRQRDHRGPARPGRPQELVDRPAAPGTVGASLVRDGGGSASLVASGGTLTLSGLDEAGTYTGMLDTQPARDGGDLKVTVDVRDFWLYALIAIALGVLIGYLLGRFYAAQRPRAGVELAAARLTQRVAQEESAWQEATTGRDYGAAYRIVGYVADQVNAAKPTATTNVDDAQTVLDALAAADGRFDGLRWRVHALVDGRDALFHALAGPAADFPEDPAWLLAVKEPLVLAHQGPDDAGQRIADRDAIVSAAEKVMTDVRAQGHRLSELAGRIEGVDDERFAGLEPEVVGRARRSVCRRSRRSEERRRRACCPVR